MMKFFSKLLKNKKMYITVCICNITNLIFHYSGINELNKGFVFYVSWIVLIMATIDFLSYLYKKGIIY